MKEMFDWLREQMKKAEYNHTYYGTDLAVNTDKAIDIIDEAEAKWKEDEAELRANVIDEFAEAIMVKATELSEKVVFDGKLVGDALSLDCVSDMVLEIALDMKGENECQ